MSVNLQNIRLALLDEMKLPDFKGRHLFVARLRLIIFMLCWGMFIVFYPDIWKVSPFVPLIFNLGFLTTAICYWYILQERYILTVGILEVLADVISQTSIIYMVGPDSVVVFLFYGLYVIGSGSFFGYLIALLSATLALVAYCCLLLLLQTGIVEPFVYSLRFATLASITDFGVVFNLVFLPIALGVVVYGAKIAHYFSKIKERALETRNIQLLALNRIGSTIRRALNLESVIEQVLKAVIQGLGFDVCFLALLSKKEDKILFYVPRQNKFTLKMEEILGRSLEDTYLPLKSSSNSTYQAIRKNRVIIRNEMSELTADLMPEITPHQALRIQKETGFKKFVITPLVAERKVVGALVGASCNRFVEDSVVDTLDNFANQAALALESAQLFEELNKKNIELEKANKIKSDFLAIMSHELRTPLTAIIGYSEILLEKVMGELNKEQNESLSEVLKNAESLLELINSILDLAKVEGGKMDLALENFSIADVVRDVQQTVSPLLKKKHQTLTVKVGDEIPKVTADSRKLRQILLNLVGNAIKFTSDNGKIEVRARYLPDYQSLKDEFNSKAKSLSHLPHVMISVSDNGIGIKKEDLGNIFDIFRQVDSTFTRKYQGTGLGLALTKQLIELHGGAIEVNSVYGEGSEFKFVIPEEVHVLKEEK